MRTMATDDGGTRQLADADLPANMPAILDRAGQALANNQAFLGLANPSNAQTVAQVQALTRQVNALIRLTLGQFDSTNGT